MVNYGWSGYFASGLVGIGRPLPNIGIMKESIIPFVKFAAELLRVMIVIIVGIE